MSRNRVVESLGGVGQELRWRKSQRETERQREEADQTIKAQVPPLRD